MKNEITERCEVTDAGQRKIRVIRFDHINGQYPDNGQPVEITRSSYAKAYYEGRIKRAINSIAVMELE